MMTLIDLLIYLLFSLFASYLAKRSEEYVEETKLGVNEWDRYLTYFVVFFTIIAAFRWDVGADNITYAVYFDRFSRYNFEKEQLWWSVITLWHELRIHWILGLALCAFVQIYFITKTMQPYRGLLVFLPFLLFWGRYWLDCMNAVRQMIVACGFLWASRFIVERSLWKYLLFVAVGTLIHQSAILLLPVYLLPGKLNLVNRRWILLGVLVVCTVIGRTPQFQNFTEYIELIANLSNLEHQAENMISVINESDASSIMAFGPIMLAYFLLSVFIIWYGPSLREEYGEKIPYYDLWYNLAFFYACFFFLTCSAGEFFIRFALYFSLFQMVMGTMVLKYLWTGDKVYGIHQTTLLFFCFVLFVSTGWQVVKAQSKPREMETYKLVFFHPEERKRYDL